MNEGEMMDVIYYETNYDGSMTLSTIYNGYRRHKLYFGYTKQEAMQDFRQWLADQD